LKFEMISMEELMQSRVKLLGSTALAAAALVMGPATASADQALEKRIKALEKAGGMYVTKSKKTMKLVVNGHVNRAIVVSDNGTESGFTHVTSNFSRTRVRWIGTGKISDDLSVKTNIELGNQSSIGTAQTLTTDGDSGIRGEGGALDERHIEFQVSSKSLGKIYMGQGISGSESTSESDLSGTGLVSLNGNAALIGGGETFQVNGASAGFGTVSQVNTNLDGLGRRDRIRYDTPKFGGFQVTGSWGNEDAHDIALRYGGSMGGVKVKGAIGYASSESIDGRETISGSLSVLMPMGISLTVGASERDNDRFGGATAETEWRYAKIGYKFKGMGSGQTRLFADISQNESTRVTTDEAEYWGIGLVQVVEPLGAELYAVYHNFSYDRGVAGTDNPDDIDRLAVGARFKF
jgi:hypothetical protein